MYKATLRILLLLIFFLSFTAADAQTTDKIVIVIIDGARYTETFGDASHAYIPKMWSLSQQGTLISNFSNDNYTFTSRAIPALWCGAWTDVQDITYQGNSTQYAVLPTIFEYYRKQKSMPSSECVYVLKSLTSLWLPSFDAEYGENYWPEFHSVGETDNDVATQAQQVMDNLHPHFLWVYLAEVDHAGHSGNWEYYTKAVFSADSIVGLLWNKIQSDDFYKNSTTLFVTNDHGRHDDQHGGFQGHGCSCEGCRHIQFLALGPTIKQNYVSSQYRTIPDMAVTASYILGINPSKATGSVMTEIFNPTGIIAEANKTFTFNGVSQNPFNNITNICYSLKKECNVRLEIFSLTGELITTLVDERQNEGEKEIAWDAFSCKGKKVKPGIYIFRLQAGNHCETGKIVFTDTSF